MEKTQSFRLIGSMAIKKIPCDNVEGQYVVSWVDIEKVFLGVQYVQNEEVVVNLMKDSNRER